MKLRTMIKRTMTILLIGVFFLACERNIKVDLESKIKQPLCTWLNNDIKHNMGRIGGINLKDLETFEKIRFIVHVEVSDNQISEFNGLTIDQKIELLNHNETDFITNLLLYHIYEDEFNMHLWGVKEMEWRNDYKKKDVEFWTSFFAARHN